MLEVPGAQECLRAVALLARDLGVQVRGIVVYKEQKTTLVCICIRICLYKQKHLPHVESHTCWLDTQPALCETEPSSL